MPTYYWDPSVARFRDETGLFVANEVVRGYVDASLRATGSVVEPLIELTLSGTLTPDELEDRIREELKREYLRNYYLGIGGRAQMTQADYGSIGGDLAYQYRKLSGFIDEIASGELSESQIRSRMRMYVNSARQAFEKAKRKSKIVAGYTEVRWVVNPAVENCEDCLAFEALGWQSIDSDPFDGCVPGSGCSVCLTNCACWLEYRVGAS